MRLFAASRRSSSRRRALLLCPLLLTGLLVLINTCDARNLRSARLSTAAAASLGMPSSPTSPSSAAAGAKGSTNNKPAPTLLFTLQSDSAFLQLGEPGDPDPDLGKLTLEGVAPTAVWFSERPDRRAGALPTATLASEALDIIVDDDDGDDELAAAGDGASSSSSSSPSSSSSSSSPPPRRQATWLGVPNVALTGTSEGGGAVRFFKFFENKRQSQQRRSKKLSPPRPLRKKKTQPNLFAGYRRPHRPWQAQLRRKDSDDDRRRACGPHEVAHERERRGALALGDSDDDGSRPSSAAALAAGLRAEAAALPLSNSRRPPHRPDAHLRRLHRQPVRLRQRLPVDDEPELQSVLRDGLLSPGVRR